MLEVRGCESGWSGPFAMMAHSLCMYVNNFKNILKNLFLVFKIIRPLILKELSIRTLVVSIYKYLLAIVANIRNLNLFIF